MSETASLLSDNDVLEDPTYRSMSKMAVMSFVSALFSPLALVAPVCWLFPVLTLALAIVAVRRITQWNGEIGGLALAKTAAAIAIVCGVFAPVRQYGREAMLFRSARVFADEFFHTLSVGRSRDAFLLHLPIDARKEILAELEAPIEKKENASQMADAMVQMMEQMTGSRNEESRFLKSELIHSFLEAHEKPEVRFEGNETIRSAPPNLEHVTLRYRAKIHEGPGRSVEKSFRVTLIRAYEPRLKSGQWRLDTVHEAR